MRMFRFLLLIVLFVVTTYVGAFVWRFDVFGSPVRDNKHGWLGPLIRGDTCAQDIGKVYFFDCDDVSSYRRFWPLCRIWLLAQGLK